MLHGCFSLCVHLCLYMKVCKINIFSYCIYCTLKSGTCMHVVWNQFCQVATAKILALFYEILVSSPKYMHHKKTLIINKYLGKRFTQLPPHFEHVVYFDATRLTCYCILYFNFSAWLI